ncbi:MAG TPA: right-handed parallel beta-helix repeat-containing protein [Thermoanaerobaculia bacterium]|jgi:hypothetical protein|nr:right-handed parallel beta-helix repeat-containing protein [Thermoanaerobaculia bacterium]
MKSLVIATSLLLSLSATVAHASSDLTLTAFGPPAMVRAGFTSISNWSVHNNGPDPATNVIVTIDAGGAVVTPSCAGGCVIPSIAAGKTQVIDQQVMYPLTATTVTMTGSVSSDSSDPNPSDNRATSTFTVSADPDVRLSLALTRDRLDLGLPFSLYVSLANFSNFAAHDAGVAIDFRTDVVVPSLPAGCSTPAAGRITCHLDELAANANTNTSSPTWKLDLTAPKNYGDGSLVFHASATERERDFDPSSNAATATARLYQTIYVTTTADAGAGSLRQAILDANATCLGNGTLCAIGFVINEPSVNPWKTIRVSSPLPALTAISTRIDGGLQTAFAGDTNTAGPEIEISGNGTVDGDGIRLSGCETELANVVVNGFLRNGVSMNAQPCNPPLFSTNVHVHDSFIGTDPTGSLARPNGERGIGVASHIYSDGIVITNNVISGNTLSGIFALSGTVYVAQNRIGLKAHSDEPLPNGASGIFIGQLCDGSTVSNNTVAFNAQMGIAVAPAVFTVDLPGNSTWANGGLGIDRGLDGPSPAAGPGGVNVPSITLAQYDPAKNKTIVEGDVQPPGNVAFSKVEVFASDAPDPSGFGEGQRPLASQSLGSFTEKPVTHFRFELDGNLTGQWISATDTTVFYNGFAKPAPEGTLGGYETTTSELSRAIQVQ